MTVDCPHCGAHVSAEARHGLSGALCPDCDGIIPDASGVHTPASRRRRRAPVGPATCPGCDGSRDREGRKCASCGAAWLYRVVAARSDDERVRERLVEYVVHRQSAASSRDKLALRFSSKRGVVLDRLTEARAQKARQEVEAFGAYAEVELDEGAADRPVKTAGPGRVVALILVAFAVLAIGVYQVLGTADPTRSASAEPEQASAPKAKTPAGPTAAVVPRVALAPEDAMAGVALAGTGSARRPVFFVDPEGWMVGPTSAGQDLEVMVGANPVRALLVRQAAGTGLGLYRMRARAPFALSIGDASRLIAGDPVYLADPSAGTLRPTNIVQPDHRVGRFVYLRLEAPTPPATLDGAPLVDARGLVVGIFDHAASNRAAMPLALPANRLTDGQAALLILIQPARRPPELMTEWLTKAAAADRAQKPEVYEAIEKTLLMTVICPGATCTGQVGVLQLEQGAPGSRVLKALFFERSQKAGADPRYGQTDNVDLTVDWQPAPLADSLLLGALPPGPRRSLVRGELPGVQLYVASYRVGRPPAAAGAPVRLMLSGASGRRSAARLIGEESP